MPAQKRPLPPLDSDPDTDGRVAGRHAAAGRGGSRGADGEADVAPGTAEPREPRDGDPEDAEEKGGGGGGGGGDGSGSDSESYLNAGSMDELSLPHPPGHLPPPLHILPSPSSPSTTPPPLLPKSHAPRVGGNHRLARIREPRSYEQKPRMPAQKRRLPWPSPKHRDNVDAPGAASSAAAAAAGGVAVEVVGGGRPPQPSGAAAKRRRLTDPKPQREDDDSGAEDGGGGGLDGDSDSSQSQSDDGGNDEFMLVKLAEIRKEVQCPICLGIIRKTRTVMECLHRFCRDCIDKSMRLGNNECPACRTHCASRRSLRDDPNYDALIAALYPDIDKYEEEELAFGEEEKTRNKKIQESIEETIRKQTEAVGKKQRSKAKETATVFARKYRRNMRRRGKGRTIAPDISTSGSDDEEREEENTNDATKDLSSAEDRSPDLRHNKGRKRPVSQPSPARSVGSTDHVFEENNEFVGGKEIFATSPLQGEMLAWGKNGARSQTRYGSGAGSNGRMTRGGRIPKLLDHLRNTDGLDKECHVYLLLLPLDGQPNMEKPYLSCRPTLSIRHLIQFIALRLSRQVEELEMYIRINHNHGSIVSKGSSTDEVKPHSFDGLERLGEDKVLSDLHPSFASSNGDLELLYALKTRD
ncbi:hypothetical protein QOZ80_1AG0036500 [Eleusine coracana subsp. coracana]|nr:hypothetical protein QOZ80_1AG0036500 [Eleusine coracana subsp. coracana]